jgi:hypothetical protein
MTALLQSGKLGNGPQKREKGRKCEKDVKLEGTN